jgi:hypothetical protein
VLPDYYLARPPTPSGATLDSFARLWTEHLESGDANIVYTLDAPRWQFLCWLADTQDVVLHGSSNEAVEVFEPRRPNDRSEFADREAVFAASDGIWAMFFAIIDRSVAVSLVNACFSVRSGSGVVAPDAVHYYFSVNAAALDGNGFSPGVVYVLPRETFEQEPDEDYSGAVIVSRQWASVEPVQPLGRLAVTPDDFPFLRNVHGHDEDSVRARAAADPTGFPWRD